MPNNEDTINGTMQTNPAAELNQKQFLSSSKIQNIDFGAKFNICYIQYDNSAESLSGLIGKNIGKKNSLVVVNCKNIFTLWVTTSDGTLNPIRSYDEANELIPEILISNILITKHTVDKNA